MPDLVFRLKTEHKKDRGGQQMSLFCKKAHPVSSLKEVCDCVLLIDMQTEFVPHIRTGRAEIIIERQIKTIEMSSNENIPIIVLEYVGAGPTIHQLNSELKKNKRIFFLKKNYDSGFSNTQLCQLLYDLECKKLLLMGVNAQYCVKATANDAILEDFEIATSEDLISGMSHHAFHDDIPWYRKNGTLISV